MSDIEARLVLRAQLGDAIKAIGELQRDLKQLAADAGMVGKAATAGVGQVGQTAKEATKAQTEAAREVTEAQTAEAAKQAALEAEAAARRKAAAEQAARDAKAKAKAAEQAAKEDADAQKKIRDAAEKDARDAANRSRMLGPQLTDIVVGLSTGQSPFSVLLQQGGQLKDMFGGIGNAAKALATVFTPLRLVFGGVAAAIGLVAAAAVQGYRQADELRKMFALTGNAAGLSAASIEESSKRIGAAQQVSIASVREAITAGASLGVFMSATLDSAARAAVSLSKLTGKAAAEQIGDFAAMADGVADWAAKANRSYNFLTAAEFAHIRSVEASGAKQEAMRLVMEKLNATIEQRSVPAVGALERIWNKVAQKVSDAFDRLRALGRDQTIEERIEQLKQLDAQLAGPGADKASQNRRVAIQKEVEDLNRLRNADALRRSEQSINAQVAQDDIERRTEAFQAAVTATEKAAYAKRIQQLQNNLEARRSIVEEDNAKGKLSQKQYLAEINAIDVDVAKLRIAQTERELAIERARQVARPADQEAKKARLLDLEKQLEEQRGLVAQVQSRGRAELAAKELDEARDDAQEWGRIWQNAFDQVQGLKTQNAEAAARRISDPIARADEEVKARLEATRKQIEALKRDLANVRDKTNDESQQRTLQETLDALSRETGPALEELARAARFDSLRSQAAEQLEAIRVKQEALTQQERTGALTTLEAELQKRQAREAAVPVLETILKALEAIQATAADKTAIESLRNSVEELKVRANDLDQLARRTLAQSFSTFFEDVSTGAERADKAALKFLANLAKAALNLIAQNLGQQLAESLLPTKGSGGVLRDLGNMILGTFTLHSGGVVGLHGAARSAPLAAFLGAPRYHSGGIAGLRPNEVPAILEAGEEVLRADDPRHRNNVKAGVTVGDIIVGVTVQGGDGSTLGQALGQRMGEAVRSKVYEVLAEESREGGMLAGRPA